MGMTIAKGAGMEQGRGAPDGAWRRPNGHADGGGGADPGGFGVVVPPHLTAMLRVAAALVGPADAEDAAQEAVLRAWQAWGSLRDVAAVKTWLLRITTNVCRDWQRGRFGTRRTLTLPLTDGEDEVPLALLAADPGASDHTGALDLREAVNALDPGLRSVVVLRYYAGLDATEIGAILNLPPPTVRTRLRRALGLLRERLGGARPSSPSHYEKGGC